MMLLRFIKRTFFSGQPKTGAPEGSNATQGAALDPSDALLSKADALSREGKWAEAESLCRQALKLNAGSPRAHYELAVTLYEQGHYDDALIHSAYAENRAPNVVDYLHLFGITHLALKNYEKARVSLKKAHQLAPRSAQILNNLGLAIRHIGNPAKAYQYFSEAAEIEPRMSAARMNKALTAMEIDRIDEAVSLAEDLLRESPDNPSYQFNLASIYMDSGRLEAAQEILQALLKTKDSSVELLRLQSQIFLKTGRIEEAETYARQAATREPSPDNLYALAEVQLLRSEWKSGWANYEERLSMAGFPYRASPLPRWQGETLQGKSIYLQSEQGIGDQIMFTSCIPDLLGQGAQITLECDERLGPLFARSFPAIQLVRHPGTLPPRGPKKGYDYVSCLGSLPRYLRNCATDFPSRPPLLVPALSAEETQLGRVGICWRGGLPRTGKFERSLKLEQLLPALLPTATQLSSLQRDETPDERMLLKKHAGRVQDFDPAWENIDALASQIASCQLVVTVCCSVAHLAGALGVPTLALTPAGAAWRYGAQGEQMHWYPSVKLLRQSGADWSAVLDRLSIEVNQILVP